MTPYNYNNRGFTLVEVVVTLIVAAILAVLLMQVMSGHITRSHWALDKLDSGLVLREVLEIINADYRKLLITANEPLVRLQSRIDAGGDSHGYWAAYGSAITVVANDCIKLAKTPGGETLTNAPCKHPQDRLLKVTLEYEDHSLTTLFSR